MKEWRLEFPVEADHRHHVIQGDADGLRVVQGRLGKLLQMPKHVPVQGLEPVADMKFAPAVASGQKVEQIRRKPQQQPVGAEFDGFGGWGHYSVYFPICLKICREDPVQPVRCMALVWHGRPALAAAGFTHFIALPIFDNARCSSAALPVFECICLFLIKPLLLLLLFCFALDFNL